MADRHKRPQRSIRLPEDLEQRIDAMAAERGIPFNALVVEALRSHLGGATAKPARGTVVRPQVMGYSKEQQARGRKP